MFEESKDGKTELPVWHDICKTSVAKEYGPQDPDWWYVRAASLARKVYLRGGSGIGDFSKVYGGTYRKGARTEHFQRASRNLVRKILQQLAHVEIVDVKADAKGRYLTSNGRRVLDTIAGQCIRN